MSFMESGFLSDESSSFVALNREKYRQYFEISSELNQEAHQVLGKAAVHGNEIDLIAAKCLFLRGLCSFASSIRLMEIGLCVDAGNTARNLLETAFYLKKAALERDWIFKYIKADLYHKKKLSNIILEEKEMAEHHQETREIQARLSDEIQKEEIPELRVFNIAKDVGDKKIYDMFYRRLSNRNTHTSSASLAPFISANEENGIEEFLYVNQGAAIPELMTPICWGILESTKSIIKLFKISHSFSEDLERKLIEVLLPRLSGVAERG